MKALQQAKVIPPFAKTAKSGAPVKSETQLRDGIARGGSAVRKKGGPPARSTGEKCKCAAGGNPKAHWVIRSTLEAIGAQRVCVAAAVFNWPAEGRDLYVSASPARLRVQGE